MDSRLFLVAFVIASAVPYIKADGNVTALSYNFTRNDCGKTKLCVQKPTGCDPSGSSDCAFTSFGISATNMTIELSGNSTGYISVALGANSNVSQGPSVVFVCGNNNGTFFFQTARFNNNTLETTSSPNVSNVQYSLKPVSLIQCSFSIPIDFKNNDSINALTIMGFNATTFNSSNLANATIGAFIDVYQGSTNGTVLGQPKSTLGSPISVNLANVNSSNTVNSTTTTNTTTTTTTVPTKATTNGSASLFSLLNHAALALLAGISLRLL